MQSSCQLELKTLQHKISRILQDAASRYFSTEGLQRLHSRIDLIIRDMTAVNRSCSSEGAVNFQPIDKRPSTSAALRWLSLTSKCRPDAEHESPLAFSALGRRLTSSRKKRNTPQERQRSTRRPRRGHKPRSPRTTVSSEGRPPGILASLASTPGHDCSYTHLIHPTPTTEMRTTSYSHILYDKMI